LPRVNVLRPLVKPGYPCPGASSREDAAICLQLARVVEYDP
jgi:hypothetical protein